MEVTYAGERSSELDPAVLHMEGAGLEREFYRSLLRTNVSGYGSCRGTEEERGAKFGAPLLPLGVCLIPGRNYIVVGGISPVLPAGGIAVLSASGISPILLAGGTTMLSAGGIAVLSAGGISPILPAGGIAVLSAGGTTMLSVGRITPVLSVGRIAPVLLAGGIAPVLSPVVVGLPVAIGSLFSAGGCAPPPPP